MELYTIARIAKILKIPESTARYYKDRHSRHIPGVGKGRRRRYKEEAINVLRLIRELADRNLTSEEIDAELDQEYGKTIEAEEETTETAITTAEQQQYVVKALSDNLKAIADQKKEIQDLREEVKELRDLVKLSWWQRIRKKGSGNNE